jgi:hypothetical protein
MVSRGGGGRKEDKSSSKLTFLGEFVQNNEK